MELLYLFLALAVGFLLVVGIRTYRKKGSGGTTTVAMAWSLVIVLLLIAGAFSLIPKLSGSLFGWMSPSVSDIADVAAKYWFISAIAWGIGALLIQLRTEDVKQKLVYQKILMWTVLTFVFGTQGWVFARDAFKATPICPDASMHETRSCVLSTAWSTWIKPAEGVETNGMQLWHTGGVADERRTVNGTTYFRYRSKEGEIVMKYRIARDKPVL